MCPGTDRFQRMTASPEFCIFSCFCTAPQFSEKIADKVKEKCHILSVNCYDLKVIKRAEKQKYPITFLEGRGTKDRSS